MARRVQEFRTAFDVQHFGCSFLGCAPAPLRARPARRFVPSGRRDADGLPFVARCHGGEITWPVMAVLGTDPGRRKIRTLLGPTEGGSRWWTFRRRDSLVGFRLGRCLVRLHGNGMCGKRRGELRRRRSGSARSGVTVRSGSGSVGQCAPRIPIRRPPTLSRHSGLPIRSDSVPQD